MEKYRRFADAATGINPFVAKVGIGSGAGVVAASSGIGTFQSSNIAPNAIVTALAMTFFPIKVVVVAVIAGLLYGLEALAEVVRMIGLQLVLNDYLLRPIIVVLSRALLTVVGAISVQRRLFPLRASPSVTVSNGAKVLDDVVLTPKAGDVVISNLVTPLDYMVLKASAPLAPRMFAPSTAAAGGVNSSGGAQKKGVAEGAWRVDDAIVAFVSHKEPRIVSFAPGAGQRWAVFNHILQTTTKAYLAEGDVGPSPIVDLSGLQAKAKKIGVPLLVYPEGTTSNGQTMLTCGNILTNTVNSCATFAADAGALRAHIISVSYESAVPAKLIESSEKAMSSTAPFFGAGPSTAASYVYNLSRRGSGTVVTSSAANFAASMDALASGVLSFLFLGPLLGYQNKARVTFVRPSQVPTSMVKVTADMVGGSATSSPLSPASVTHGVQVVQGWVNDVRLKLCASVSFGNPNVICKPVAVGIAEKRAYSLYVEQETAKEVGAGEADPAAAPSVRPGKINPVLRGGNKKD